MLVLCGSWCDICSMFWYICVLVWFTLFGALKFCGGLCWALHNLQMHHLRGTRKKVEFCVEFWLHDRGPSMYIYVCVHICIHVYNFYPHLYGHLHALVFRIGSSPTGGLSAKASGNDRFRPKKCERRPPNLVESWPTFWGRFLVHKTGLLHVMLQGGPNFGAPKGVHFWDRKFA